MENSIEVKGLVREFKDGILAVAGIDLHVAEGEIYGFLGPNGAGKSTTVHMLVTLLPPTSGTATVAGYDVVETRPGRAPLDRRRAPGRGARPDPHRSRAHASPDGAACGSARRAQGARRRLLERVGLPAPPTGA